MTRRRARARAQAMLRLRALLFAHPRLVAVLLVLALAVKALVPAGYMLSATSVSLSVGICSGMTGERQTIAIPINKPIDASKSSLDKHGCPYSALDDAGSLGADGAQLALALAFILLVGLAPKPRLGDERRRHRWPPMRGPPALS